MFCAKYFAKQLVIISCKLFFITKFVSIYYKIKKIVGSMCFLVVLCEKCFVQNILQKH